MPEQNLRDGGPTVRDTHVIRAEDCAALTITDLTVHGARQLLAGLGRPAGDREVDRR